MTQRFVVLDVATAKTTEPYASMPELATVGLPTQVPDPQTGVVTEVPSALQLVFDLEIPAAPVFLGVLLSDTDLFPVLNALALSIGQLDARLQAVEALVVP